MTLISVTQEDIISGQAVSSQGCPIALAMNRTLQQECLVGSKDVIIDHMFHDLPQIAQWFVLEFDAQRTVTPFMFDFDDSNPMPNPKED